jgi:hypothetical protein
MAGEWRDTAKHGYPGDGVVVEIAGTETDSFGTYSFENRAKRVKGVWWSSDESSIYPDDRMAHTGRLIPRSLAGLQCHRPAGACREEPKVTFELSRIAASNPALERR